MCKYCENEFDVLRDENMDVCNIEVFMNNFGQIEVNTYNLNELGDTPSVATSIEVNYCPMCGRNLIEDKKANFIRGIKDFKYDLKYDWKEAYNVFSSNGISDYVFKSIWDMI